MVHRIVAVMGRKEGGEGSSGRGLGFGGNVGIGVGWTDSRFVFSFFALSGVWGMAGFGEEGPVSQRPFYLWALGGGVEEGIDGDYWASVRDWIFRAQQTLFFLTSFEVVGFVLGLARG